MINKLLPPSGMSLTYTFKSAQISPEKHDTHKRDYLYCWAIIVSMVLTELAVQDFFVCLKT